MCPKQIVAQTLNYEQIYYTAPWSEKAGESPVLFGGLYANSLSDHNYIL
jgi:hypothetical protein